MRDLVSSFVCGRGFGDRLVGDRFVGDRFVGDRMFDFGRGRVRRLRSMIRLRGVFRFVRVSGLVPRFDRRLGRGLGRRRRNRLVAVLRRVVLFAHYGNPDPRKRYWLTVHYDRGKASITTNA